MKSLRTIPFLRLIIPFVLGIIVACKFKLPIATDYFIIVSFVLIFLYLSVKKCRQKNQKIIWLLAADLFFILFAFSIVNIKNKHNQDVILTDNNKAITYIAQIDDIPIEKEKTIKCNLRIKQIKVGEDYLFFEGNIIAYFKKPCHINLLDAGKELVLKSKWIDVATPKNPEEFDYKTYLERKQIFYTTFLETGTYQFIDSVNTANSVWKFGLKIKASLLHTLKNSNLNKDAYSICSALLTGYDDDIDKSVVDSFSHSGTLHVLSVSGLHTGVIYLVLNFMFNLLDKHKNKKVLRFGFITIVLWLFALITGFSAPVLRAVIMFNLFGLGDLFFRNTASNRINILLVSAFILLVYNPFFIFDVGFLLSYFALFGLIYFQPIFSQLLTPSNGILMYLWETLTASLAATVSTLPITLFYFKQFPMWFFLCNMLVVPASFLILALSIFVLFKINFFATILNYCVYVLIQFIQFFNSDKYGYIDSLDFRWSDVYFLTAIIVLASIILKQKSYAHIAFLFLVIIVWQFTCLIQSYQSKNKSLFTVYHTKLENHVTLKNKTKVYINQINGFAYNYSIKPHLNTFNNSENIKKEFNYFKSENISFLILNKRHYWPKVDLKCITTLLVSNNFCITEENLASFTQLKLIITDATNNNKTIKNTEELCRKFGVNFFNSKETGAVLLALK